jgi:drug/metabolite transporter (DMT)-like permease
MNQPAATNITDLRSALALVTLGAAFGAAFVFMKVLVDEISTFEIVAGRLALGAAALALVIAVRGRGLTMTRGNFVRISALAVVDTIIPFSLVAWAETRIDAGLASLLISTMPIFTVFIAMTVLPDERLSAARIAALPIGAAGVIVLTGGDLLSLGSGDAVGQLAVIGAALTYGVGAVYSKVLLRTNDPFDLSVTKVSVGAIVAAALVLPTAGTPAYGSLSLEGWASLAGLGLVSTALAFTVYLWLVRRAGSVYSSLVTYVVPVFGVLLGWAVLGESVGPETAAGGILIAASVGTAMYGHRLADVFRGRRSEIVQAPAPAAARIVQREEFA